MPLVEKSKPAGFWVRLAAVSLDNLIFWALIAVFMIPLALYTDYSPKAFVVTALGLNMHPDYNPLYLLINLSMLLPLYYLWAKFQASPGKLLLNLRIVDNTTEAKPARLQIFLRTMGYIISSIPMGAGFLWIATNKEKRGWHDYIASTKVICIK